MNLLKRKKIVLNNSWFQIQQLIKKYIFVNPPSKKKNIHNYIGLLKRPQRSLIIINWIVLRTTWEKTIWLVLWRNPLFPLPIVRLINFIFSVFHKIDCLLIDQQFQKHKVTMLRILFPEVKVTALPLIVDDSTEPMKFNIKMIKCSIGQGYSVN